mgnify:CR=1 FL=1
MKKKIIPYVFIFIILILLIFILINFFNFNKIYTKINENYKITNFHYIRENNSNRYDITRNNNLIILKIFSYTDDNVIPTFTFYTNGNENYVFNETNKTYNCSEQDQIGGLKFLYTGLEFNNTDLNLMEKLKLFFNTRIKKVNQNGISCYRITKKSSNYDFYIDANNYLIVSSNNDTCKDYQLNSITSEDITMPNLEEYQLIQ